MIHGSCRRCATVCFTASDLCGGCAGHEVVFLVEPRSPARVKPEAIAIAVVGVVLVLLWRLA